MVFMTTRKLLPWRRQKGGMRHSMRSMRFLHNPRLRRGRERYMWVEGGGEKVGLFYEVGDSTEENKHGTDFVLRLTGKDWQFPRSSRLENACISRCSVARWWSCLATSPDGKVHWWWIGHPNSWELSWKISTKMELVRKSNCSHLIELTEEKGEYPKRMKNGVEINPGNPGGWRHQHADSDEGTILMKVVHWGENKYESVKSDAMLQN